jgi:23S rRNA (adenine2503-C2)-methyltransferase
VTSTMTRFDATRADLGALLDGEPRYRVDQIWRGLYEELRTPDELTNVPKALRRRLADELAPALDLVTVSESDDGETVKFLWGIAG